MAICDFCLENILESGKPWDYHQKSHEHLKKAADERCDFCSSLQQDVDNFCKTSSVDPSHWPLHRWSVRRPGWIRESTRSVLVTFRPIPRRGGDQDREGIEGNGRQLGPGEGTLPERIFYLFPEEGNVRLVVGPRKRATDRKGRQISDTFPRSESSGTPRIRRFRARKSRNGQSTVEKITNAVGSGTVEVEANSSQNDSLPSHLKIKHTCEWSRRSLTRSRDRMSL